MKKAICMLLVGAVLMAGCGSSTTSTVSESATAASAEAANTDAASTASASISEEEAAFTTEEIWLTNGDKNI